jgi:hypothetical protein
MQNTFTFQEHQMTRQFGFKLSVISLSLAVMGCSPLATIPTNLTNLLTLRGAEADFADTSAKLNESEVPPNAKAGECYARVYTPPVYTTKSDSLLKRAAAEKIDIVPAQFQEATQQVMVRAATRRLEIVPAQYEWVEERVTITPASKRIQEVAAVYETVTEQVLDKPAYSVWKKGTSSPIQQVDAATGEIMCLVEIPATYKTVTKQVLKTPAMTQEIEVPAEYTVVKKQIEKMPATTQTVEVPAEFNAVKISKMVAPAREVRTPIPAEYQTVTQNVLAKPASVEWRQILCATNTTPETVSTIQRALTAAGFKPGRSDGVITKETFEAVRDYQTAKGLPVDNDRYINIQTAKSLGL